MKYTNSVQIKDRRATLRKRADEIISTAKREVRELTEEELAEIEAIKTEVEELKQAEIDLMKRLEALENPVNEDVTADDETEIGENEEINEERNKISMRKKKFSLVKAVRQIANGQPLDAVSRAVVAAGKNEAARAGISAQGQIQIPTEMRDAVSVATEGDDLVATELWDIMQPLRAKNVLAKAGARIYSNLVGNVQIPIMTGSNVGWEGEIAPAKDGGAEFSHKTLSPKRLTAYIDVSKMLLAQDSVDVEMALRNDLIAAINTKLEQTILSDARVTATNPGGILSEVEPVEIADYEGLCELEADVEDANVIGECAYVTSNRAKAVIRTLAKGGNQAANVWVDGTIDGTPAYNTSNVSGSNVIFGDFSNLAIGSWGGIDLCVDPYTKAADAQVRIVINAFFDAAVLRPEAFAAGYFSE